MTPYIPFLYFLDLNVDNVILKVTCVKSWMKGTGIMNCIDLEVHLTGIKSLFTFRIRIRLYDFLDKKPKFFGGKEMVIRNWMIDTFILSPNTACFGRKVNSFTDGLDERSGPFIS